MQRRLPRPSSASRLIRNPAVLAIVSFCIVYVTLFKWEKGHLLRNGGGTNPGTIVQKSAVSKSSPNKAEAVPDTPSSSHDDSKSNEYELVDTGTNIDIVLDLFTFQSALRDTANSIISARSGRNKWVAYISSGFVKNKGHFDRYEERLIARGVGTTLTPDLRSGIPLFGFAQCWATAVLRGMYFAKDGRVLREAYISNTPTTVTNTKLGLISKGLKDHFSQFHCPDSWSSASTALRPHEFILETEADCQSLLLSLRRNAEFKNAFWALIPWKPTTTVAMQRHETPSLVKALGQCTKTANYIVQVMEPLKDGKFFEVDVLILVSSFYPYTVWYHEMSLFDGKTEAELDFGDEFTPEETLKVRRRIKAASSHLAITLKGTLQRAHNAYVLLNARFSIGSSMIPKLLHVDCNVHGRTMRDATIDGLIDIIVASKRNPVALGKLAAATSHSNDTLSKAEPWWELVYTEAVAGGWSYFDFETCYPDMEVNEPYAYKMEVSSFISKVMLQADDGNMGYSPGPVFTEIDRIAAEVSEKHKEKGFAIIGQPHFVGGFQQFNKYMTMRGWTRKQGLNGGPEVVMLPCYGPLAAAWSRWKPGRLISSSPHERSHVTKRPFFRAVHSYFKEQECDYTLFHPQTFLIDEDPTQCVKFLEAAKALPPSTKWFLKSRVESFGRGITVIRSSEAPEVTGNCERPRQLNFFAQRGVDNIFLYDGRVTQGRAYLLVSSYKPWTAWFFDGYYNVAQVKVETDGTKIDKNANVPNMGSNQGSRRLLPTDIHDYIIQLGRPESDYAKMRHNIKQVALNVFMSLKGTLEEHAGAYTLFGFDTIVDNDMEVHVLEANCNCELFNNPVKFGRERVETSSILVREMMDAVFATNWDVESFREKIFENDALNSTLRDSSEQVVTKFPRSTKWDLELLYTEAVSPTWSYVPIGKGKCFPQPMPEA